MKKSEPDEHDHLALESKQIAKDAFTDALRTLANNILAISSGQGAPAEVIDEIVRIAECLIVFNEVHGVRPSSELIRMALTELSRNSQA